jgi:hypothetical protein
MMRDLACTAGVLTACAVGVVAYLLCRLQR